MPDLPEPTISDEAVSAVIALIYGGLAFKGRISYAEAERLARVIVGLKSERDALQARIATQQEMIDNYHLMLERLKNAR